MTLASYRKKPQDIEGPDKPPVATAPQETAAQLPPAAETETKPVEIETESPVKQAEKNSIQARLDEVLRAETLRREAIQQQPRLATEPQQVDPLEAFLANVPEAARDWLRAHPEYMTDPEKSAAAQHFHWSAVREAGGEPFTPKYWARLERDLGIAPNGNGKVPTDNLAHSPVEIERPAPMPPRMESPPPRQQRQSAPVSAPPTREAPSMTTGRAPTQRAPLTADERQVARNCGLTDEQYQQQKDKMNRLKVEGVIQDGR
jgi:hypothetical protein